MVRLIVCMTVYQHTDHQGDHVTITAKHFFAHFSDIRVSNTVENRIEIVMIAVNKSSGDSVASLSQWCCISLP